MKKHYFKILLSIFTLLCNLNSYSQTETAKEKISKTIEDYFSLERENIHIQFNKNTFLSNEAVWFKGYVYNRKDKVPFFYTTNVYASVYDEAGIKVENKLLYSNSGCFSGKFTLDETYKSGKYYLHVFTNWMNNFKEDESAIFEFNVINEADKTFAAESIADYSKVNIDFSPEGGAIIDGVLNTIGIRVSDCNKNPIPVSEIEILNSQGIVTQKVAINKFGYGKFPFLADGKVYKASVSVNEQKFEATLPAALPTGISLEINNYIFRDRAIAKIKTNQGSIENYKSNPLFLVIQQDNKSAVLNINFDNNELEQTIIFSNNNLFEGVNTIRIIDSNLKQIAERSIFKFPEENLSLNLDVPKKNKEGYSITGKFNLQYTNASISVLPEQSLISKSGQDIMGSILIRPYFTVNNLDVKYYFTETTKLKQYELDLLLLNQGKSKYKWETILAAPPTIVYDFDMGLTLKGTVNQTLSDRKKYRVQLYSIGSQLNEFSEINEKNEFYFKNLVVADSSWVNFSLVTYDEKITPLKVYPQVLNLNRTFNKPFKIDAKLCSPILKNTEIEMPLLNKEAITLKEVDIEVDKNKLNYKKQLGNGNLRGYKITDDDPSINMDVISFIRNNGFDVQTTMGQVQIFSRTSSSLGGGRNSPAVFIGGIQQMNFDLLQTMRIKEVDEIYINAHSTVPGSRNTIGIIKIYPRTTFGASKKNATSVKFQINNAFSTIDTFKNSDYFSTENKGFQNFGIVNWIPSITTQETGEFKFDIPNLNQKKVKLLIEGFSADGKLISEIRTIDLP